MPKQHTINLEAVIKAALDKNSEKIIDDFEKKITEPKEINIKTDEHLNRLRSCLMRLTKNKRNILKRLEKEIKLKQLLYKVLQKTQISMYNQQYMIKKDVHLLLIRIRTLMEDSNLITRMVS